MGHALAVVATLLVGLWVRVLQHAPVRSKPRTREALDAYIRKGELFALVCRHLGINPSDSISWHDVRSVAMSVISERESALAGC